MCYFTFSGGECFVRPDLLDLWKKHRLLLPGLHNGTLLDDATVGRLVKAGNVAPMVSVGGSGGDRHEESRGCMIACWSLRQALRAGLLFGFSAAQFERRLSLRRLEEMLDHGCKVGWFFKYIPGDDPDLGYWPPLRGRPFTEGHRMAADTPYSSGTSGMTAPSWTTAWPG